MDKMISSLEQLSREQSAKEIATAYTAEIERAVDNVKRTSRDRWWRRHWYKASAQRRRRQKGLPTGWRRRTMIQNRKLMQMSNDELAQIIARLIHTNDNVRAAVMDAVCCCPHIMTRY